MYLCMKIYTFMDEDKDFLRQDNNYRTLKAFQKAECIYDVTYYFANTFLKVGDRTIDQMVQAARSGKQNLAEGNIDGITSREMELKLTNVNRASPSHSSTNATSLSVGS